MTLEVKQNRIDKRKNSLPVRARLSARYANSKVDNPLSEDIRSLGWRHLEPAHLGYLAPAPLPA